MLIYTRVSEGCHIVSTSHGVLVYGKDKQLVEEIRNKISKSNGRYWLYPDKIVFYDELDDKQREELAFKTYEESHQNKKTSIWKKLFGH